MVAISRIITEYSPQILEDSKGRQFVVHFPEEIIKATQYGVGFKGHSVYELMFETTLNKYK